ncbi:MAG: T9SS type A sorting domain-containing protein [Flavobacteriaceae bacterium]|nr:T9SS type A sorting domain-containing protein [Flavobacteriaceae bacterium]
MKKILYAFVLIFTLLFAQVAAQQWLALGADDFNKEAGISIGTHSSVSLALDAAGKPYVAFQNTEGTIVKKFNDNNWEDVGVDGELVGYTFNNSIAIAPDGMPYVVYTDEDNGNKLIVKKYDGSQWVKVGDVVSDKEGFYRCIAIDPSGTPFVLYMDSEEPCSTVEKKTLTVKKFDGSVWVDTGLVGYPGWNPCSLTVHYPALTISDSGTPFIAFLDSDNANKIAIKKYSNGVWSSVGDAFDTGWSSNHGILHFSLVIDRSGNPYLAYGSFRENLFMLAQPIEVKKFDGTSWVDLSVEKISEGSGFFSSMVLDRFDTPYVAYLDTNNDLKVTVKRFNGVSWTNVGPPGVSYEGVMNAALAIDHSDNLILVYNSSGLYAKKFATASLATDTVAQTDLKLSLYPNPAFHILSVQSKLTITKVAFYSILGIKIKEVYADFNAIGLEDLSRGVYLLSIHSENGVTVRKLIKD